MLPSYCLKEEVEAAGGERSSADRIFVSILRGNLGGEPSPELCRGRA